MTDGPAACTVILLFDKVATRVDSQMQSSSVLLVFSGWWQKSLFQRNRFNVLDLAPSKYQVVLQSQFHGRISLMISSLQNEPGRNLHSVRRQLCSPAQDDVN